MALLMKALSKKIAMQILRFQLVFSVKFCMNDKHEKVYDKQQKLYLVKIK